MRNLIYRHVARAVMALLMAFPVLAQALSPNPGLNALVAYGDASRWTLPTLGRGES